MTLLEHIKEAKRNRVAIGHFNISNLEGLWGIFRAAQSLNLPVIIGVSEGERDFVGVRQVVALVKSLREQYDYPIFLNADHTYSLERVKEAVDAGFDAVIFDGSKLPFAENVAITKQAVEYAKNKNPGVVVEGELGYIGTSSKLLDAVPAGVSLDEASLVKPEESREFVAATGVDLLAPAVGNIHGMLRGGEDPALNIERIQAISEATNLPLVLHGGSGNEKDFKAAIWAGMTIVHINTEIRVAYRDALRASLQENPDEVAPYKILKPAVQEIQKVVEKRLKIFNNL